MQLFSIGDFIDLSVVLRQKSLHYFVQHFSSDITNRVQSTWQCIDRQSSDWWLIPAVRRRWNRIISGDERTNFIQYVHRRYLQNASGLRMLSVGSGGGTAEIEFAQTGCFAKVTGVDISPHIAEYAARKAERAQCKAVEFICGDAEIFSIEKNAYDFILFNSSLHHMKDPEAILRRANSGLKEGGFLILNEYTGPNRFQYDSGQMKTINTALQGIPLEYRKRKNSFLIKHKVYRPGFLRQVLSDPSEAVRSEELMGHVRNIFTTVEEKKTGGTILHPLLKDIAHHFIDETPQKLEVLEELFRIEDEYIVRTGKSDFVFGLFSKTFAEKQ